MSADDIWNQAKELLKQGRLRASRGSFEQLAKYGDSYAERGYFGIGMTSKLLNEREQAKSAFEKVLEINPEHPGALLELARLAPLGFYGTYDRFREDKSSLAQEALKLLYKLSDIHNVHPSPTAYMSNILADGLRGLCLIIAGLILWWLGKFFGGYGVFIGVPLISVGFLFVLFKMVIGYVGIVTTTYTIRGGRIQIDEGILSRSTTTYELFRIHTIVLKRTVLNRVTQDGTLIFAIEHETQPLEIKGLMRGRKLQDHFQDLQNLVGVLRSMPGMTGPIH